MTQAGEVLTAIRHTIKLYEQCLDQVRADYGLSRLEINILSFLHNNPCQDTAAQISEMRMLSKGNVSQAAELLLHKGYLRREPDQNDRRWIHLKLEPAAQPIIADITKSADAFESLLFQGFTAEQREEYRQLNQICFANVQKALEGRKTCANDKE